MRNGKIAYQGEAGANSHIACREALPDHEPLACRTFEEAFQAVALGQAQLAMIPIDNSIAGRVADIHHLLPSSDLHIIGEHFLRVHHQLLIRPEANIEDIKTVRSHVHALGQCRKIIQQLNLISDVASDTAGAARELAQSQDKSIAAIATAFAAEIYGLKIVRSNIEDETYNMTRFIILSAQAKGALIEEAPIITSLIFRLRNVPAALYKALGGFATAGVNIYKLESYQLEGQFSATQFYADIEGHPNTQSVRIALEELAFFTSYARVLGVYRASPYRTQLTGTL